MNRNTERLVLWNIIHKFAEIRPSIAFLHLLNRPATGCGGGFLQV
jgi:hypothetical protein